MDIVAIRNRAEAAISPLKLGSSEWSFGTRTNAGSELPEYYLVYFLLVDLLGFDYIGSGEKIAWSIPVDLNGKVFFIEHRKFGLGIFAPDDDDSEAVAQEIVQLIKKSVRAARPYFDWRADEALKGPEVNVYNDSVDLFGRYEYLRGLFETKLEESQSNRGKTVKRTLENGATSYIAANYQSNREMEWLAIGAIESFFSWTEHVFIHLAILQSKITTGEGVDELAAQNWKAKFKAALDVSDSETKRHYDDLIAIRNQVRNFVAHGSFGKNGEAFSFHSGAGAVPVMLPHRRNNRSNLFPDADALETIRKFVEYLRSGQLSPAWIFLDSHLNTILTDAQGVMYQEAMTSDDEMRSFVEYREYIEDMYTNMDF